MPPNYDRISITYSEMDIQHGGYWAVCEHSIDNGVTWVEIGRTGMGSGKTSTKTDVFNIGANSQIRLGEEGGGLGPEIIIKLYKTSEKYIVDFPEKTNCQINDKTNIELYGLYDIIVNNLSFNTDDYLILWYKLDGNYDDSSGNNNTLMPQGNPNNGLTFNTTSDNDFPYSHWAFSTQTANQAWATSPYINKDVPITIAFWFRDTSTTLSTIMSYGDFPTGAIQFDINTSGTLTVHTALNNHWTTAPTATGLLKNVWYHCAYVLTDKNNETDSRVKTFLYINGVLKSTGIGNANQTLMDYDRLTVANSGDGGRGFEGDIGDIKIYNRALFGLEIYEIYNKHNKSLKIYNIDNENNIITSYIHDGSANNNTEYNLNFSEDTLCDILIVGGGGGGGSDNSGGGGAGGLVFLQDITLNGNIVIKVGKGGNGANADQSNKGSNGIFSSIIYTETFVAEGGGGGGTGQSGVGTTNAPGEDGGSGGGSAREIHNALPGISIQNQYILNGVRRGWGFSGGTGKIATQGSGCLLYTSPSPRD